MYYHNEKIKSKKQKFHAKHRTRFVAPSGEQELT